MLALTAKFLRQIVPPVIATLIAAVLIAGFNRAFSTHLTQPRMAAVNPGAEEPARPRVAPTNTAVATPVVELTIEPVIERLHDKGEMREAAKDQIRITEAPAAPQQAPTRRSEPRAAESRPSEPRAAEPRLVEPRPAEPYLVPAPGAPAPVVMAPPAVAGPIVAASRQEPVLVPADAPMVTIPDRQRPQPQSQPHIEEPPAHGPLGAIVNTLKPSSLFARARELGEKIEAAGNEILPSIRN